jgi:putative Mn2+ efflux pump MntP
MQLPHLRTEPSGFSARRNNLEDRIVSWNFMFFINSALLGVGLAMDAFSVSMANGLSEPRMSRRRQLGIAGVFAGFQALMPMIGWICVHTIVRYFRAFEKLIPWIALFLLAWIGGKMLYDGIRGGEGEETSGRLTLPALLIQGVATSIDALSVGFTIADYALPMAIVCALIIAVVTFFICAAGLRIGKRFGTRLAGRAQILGGIILIGIGLEIFLTGIF